jgi:hypothetical protein
VIVNAYVKLNSAISHRSNGLSCNSLIQFNFWTTFAVSLLPLVRSQSHPGADAVA